MNFNGKVTVLVIEVPADWDMPRGRLSKILLFLNLLKTVWQIFYCGACKLISHWYFLWLLWLLWERLCLPSWLVPLCSWAAQFFLMQKFTKHCSLTRSRKAHHVFREKQGFCKGFCSPSISPPHLIPEVFSWDAGSSIQRHSASRFCRWMGILF